MLLHEFLSALFTGGDGSAYYRPEKSDCIVNYTTASPALRQELSLLLTSLGMSPHIVELYGEEERRTLYRLQLNGRKNIETFARYATFLDERQNHIDRFLSAVKGTRTAEREETVVEIGSAEPTGEYVYDLFLDGDGSEESHTFYASDGLLIHNCQDWDLRYFFYYGLMPDGNGTKASVAGPPRSGPRWRSSTRSRRSAPPRRTSPAARATTTSSRSWRPSSRGGWTTRRSGS
ncbi:hypothetical protein [Methanoculleus chikugoensis]|uniref:LAGLIDADG family homing endonuclease n=1 Tax=Methanoculleus chikugoensis TaxID=118126 RepID=UPI001FB1B1D9|nr:LAGLIDADG family homing endonuclease [Methanoculleus chikugoensis]